MVSVTDERRSRAWNGRHEVSSGDLMKLGIRTRQLHLFDPATENALL